MEQQLKLFRVFIASPSDLGQERRALREVVEKINAIYSKETEWRIELLGWEDTPPGAGRPQELINADLDKADLFIGCLWQRWGSSSGSGGKTGFEEEFDRSLERRTKDGSPEMWVFFKEVEPVRRGDPGEQLQKVLAFRAQEIEAKRLVFKEFRDVAAWREMLSDLLQRHMLRLVTARPVSERNVQSTGTPQSQAERGKTAEDSPKSQAKGASAVTSLAELLKVAEQKVRAGKLAVFDRSEALEAAASARLLLFAAANYDHNSQHIQFGPHEMNSAYWHRKALDLTALERLVLLRTVLLDGTLTKPGWFWISEWKLKSEIWLPWFASLDSDPGMRVKATDLASRIGFALYRNRKKSERPIDRLLADQQASVRLAALRHLASLGRPADLPTVERLLQDDDKDVRTQADRTGRLIRLRADPDAETKKSVDQGDAFDEEMANAVAQRADRLADETLKRALAHPSGALRAVASGELLKRGSAAVGLARQMCGDEAKAVKEHGYWALVAHGVQLSLSEVRSSLEESDFSYSSDVPPWNKAEPEKVISACFDRLSAEELWKRAYAFDHDSHLALLAIGRRFFEQDATRIRAELTDNFEKQAAIAKKQRPDSTLGLYPLSSILSESNSIESIRKRLRVSALQVLADHATENDRDLFLKFLSADSGEFEQNVACLRGLSSVGQVEDRAEIWQLLSSHMPFVQAAAARAYLALSPTSVVAAKDLLGQPSEYRVWVIVRHALKCEDRSLWSILQPLLGHENESIRRLVCYYAKQTLTKASMVRLLEDYLGRGFYYYNVVTLLDRALYAPAVLRDAYSQDEEEFFEKWRPSATWHWQEQ